MKKSTLSDAYQVLPDSIKVLVQRIIHDINPEEIILFGSRARGDHRVNSDFDLAIKAKKIPADAWARLQIDLQEEPITLYQVDLVDFSQMDDRYKSQITREGKALYVR